MLPDAGSKPAHVEALQWQSWKERVDMAFSICSCLVAGAQLGSNWQGISCESVMLPPNSSASVSSGNPNKAVYPSAVMLVSVRRRSK